jgi:hypothetical protein
VEDMRIIYNDTENDVIAAKPINSAAGVISSITGTIKEYIKSVFPDTYFKREFIETAETVSEQIKQRSNNINDIFINEYPLFVITPQLSLDEPFEGFGKSHLTSSTNLFTYKNLLRNYKTIMFDPFEKIGLYYTEDFVTTNFEIKIAVRKFIQNTNLTYFLKSAFEYEWSQYLNNQPIEFEIPRTFIRAIARKLYGNDWDEAFNTPEKNKEFETYLMRYTRGIGVITRKLNYATGSWNYYFRREVDLVVRIETPDSPSQMMRNGQDESDYLSSFRVQVSYWMPNAFILSMEGLKELIPSVEEEDSDTETVLSTNFTTRAARIPVYKTHNQLGEEIIAQEVFWQNFIMISNVQQSNIEIGSLMSTDLKKIIEYCLQYNIDIDNLIFKRVFSGNTMLKEITQLPDGSEHKSFEIDWETLRINIDNPDYNVNYNIGLYIDKLQMETILKAAEEKLDITISDDIVTQISIYSDDDQELIFNVYSFKDETELYSIKPEYSLRTKTKYGIGYIYNESYDENIDYDDAVFVDMGEYGIRVLSNK